MTLRDLHGRLERARMVCSACGSRYGSRVMGGAWLRTGGVCQVCDADTTVYPVEVFDHLRHGRTLVGRMAGGQGDERTILRLLNAVEPQRQEVA